MRAPTPASSSILTRWQDAHTAYAEHILHSLIVIFEHVIYYWVGLTVPWRTGGCTRIPPLTAIWGGHTPLISTIALCITPF